MVCKSVFNLMIAALLFLSCKDIPRDNLLDPGNPNSYRQSVVLLEAFVNTANPYPYNQMALAALDSIKNQYQDQVVIVEYHRSAPDYQDSLDSPVFENLYQKYVGAFSPSQKGVPDIFINGTGSRVQGASSTQNVFHRLNPLLSDLVVERNYFTLEPGEIKWDGSKLNATCLIARLGDQPAEDLLLKMVPLRQINSASLKRVALDLKKSVSIAQLEAGEISTQKFGDIALDEKPDALVFYLSSDDELTVYQAIRVDL